MKKLVKFSAIAALFLCSSLAANAQIKVGIDGGAQIPMGSLKDFSKTGFGGDLNGKYMLNPNMGVGLSVGYYSFGGKELVDGTDTTSSISSQKVENTIIPITANFTYYFSEGSFKPYAGVDLGAYIVKSKTTIVTPNVAGLTDGLTNGLSSLVSGFSSLAGERGLFDDLTNGITDAMGATTTTSTTTTNTKIGFAPFVGFEYSFSESLALNMNVKYNCILDGTVKKDDLTKKAMASTVGINLGVVYSFGGK
jgi:outer membrane protein W